MLVHFRQRQQITLWWSFQTKLTRLVHVLLVFRSFGRPHNRQCPDVWSGVASEARSAVVRSYHPQNPRLCQQLKILLNSLPIILPFRHPDFDAWSNEFHAQFFELLTAESLRIWRQTSGICRASHNYIVCRAHCSSKWKNKFTVHREILWQVNVSMCWSKTVTAPFVSL